LPLFSSDVFCFKLAREGCYIVSPFVALAYVA
jgi:hypothetical protein